jgi:branched-chain amino acid transport system substrate-binding protein
MTKATAGSSRHIDRRTMLAGLGSLAFLAAPSVSFGESATRIIRLGILSDFSNVFSTSGGMGLVEGVKLAVSDFEAEAPDAGFKVEVIYADHQQKADVGAAIAKQWYERDGVDAVIDVVNSAVAFAVIEETRKHNKVALISGAGSARLTGDLCTPNTIHWTYDTYEVGNAIGTAVTAAGGKSWFFITADYAFGKDLEAGTTAAVTKAGGKVIGSVRHPINTQDFSSFLLQAHSSGADVVGFANAGGDLVTSLKQAHEFGMQAKQRLAAINANIVDIKSVGLAEAQGILLAEPFYWDINDNTRAWTRRFIQRYKTSYPTLHHAGSYASTLHYLRAAQKAGTNDGDKIVAAMKSFPTRDGVFSDGYVRQDGRVIHDIYVMAAKRPSEAKGDWDLFTLQKTIPGDAAFRPLTDGNCPLVR